MLVSSELVTATSISASSAPASRNTRGCEPWPCTTRRSNLSCSTRKREGSLSTTVMSLFSPTRFSASVPPTWPAPRIIIFMDTLLLSLCAALFFHQLSVEETVAAIDGRENLPAVKLPLWQCLRHRIVMRREESLDLLLVLLRQH